MDEQRNRLIALLEAMVIKYAGKELNTTIMADYLLENGVIVPPCKVGDVIFCHTYDHKEYAPIEVRSLGSLMRWVEDGDFGKWLFLTPEKAEAALAERTGGKI